MIRKSNEKKKWNNFSCESIKVKDNTNMYWKMLLIFLMRFLYFNKSKMVGKSMNLVFLVIYMSFCVRFDSFFVSSFYLAFFKVDVSLTYL